MLNFYVNMNQKALATYTNNTENHITLEFVPHTDFSHLLIHILHLECVEPLLDIDEEAPYIASTDMMTQRHEQVLEEWKRVPQALHGGTNHPTGTNNNKEEENFGNNEGGNNAWSSKYSVDQSLDSLKSYGPTGLTRFEVHPPFRIDVHSLSEREVEPDMLAPLTVCTRIVSGFVATFTNQCHGVHCHSVEGRYNLVRHAMMIGNIIG